MLLGDGHHAAQERRRQHAGDRESAPAARADRQTAARASAPCAGTATCRATARWASGNARPKPSSMSSARSSTSRRRANHGFDTVEAIKAMHEGRVKVFFAHGRQFSLRHARHGIHCRSVAPLPPHRAGLYQAQPRAPHHGRAGADPPLSRPHRSMTCRQAASSSSPSKNSMGVVQPSRGTLAARLRTLVERTRDRRATRGGDVLGETSRLSIGEGCS